MMRNLKALICATEKHEPSPTEASLPLPLRPGAGGLLKNIFSFASRNVVAAYALRRVKYAGMDAVSGFTMFVNCCYHTYTIKALEGRKP